MTELAIKSPALNNAGLQNRFEVFGFLQRRPSCLAGYFTWPQVALTHHAFHRAYTPRSQRLSSFDNGINLVVSVLFFLSR
jgi:hypothetical protein